MTDQHVEEQNSPEARKWKKRNPFFSVRCHFPYLLFLFLCALSLEFVSVICCRRRRVLASFSRPERLLYPLLFAALFSLRAIVLRSRHGDGFRFCARIKDQYPAFSQYEEVLDLSRRQLLYLIRTNRMKRSTDRLIRFGFSARARRDCAVFAE